MEYIVKCSICGKETKYPSIVPNEIIYCSGKCYEIDVARMMKN